MAAAHGVSSDDDQAPGAQHSMNVLVLGPVGVGSEANGFATPSSNILRAVLAALALAGPSGLSAGELFETVWGSRDARSMDSTLTVNIHRLRQWLRTATHDRVTVTRTTTGYALGLSGGEVDAHRFLRLADAAEPLDGPAKAEALGAALALWRGPALADVPDGSADQPAVVRLELRRVTAVVDYARVLLGGGQPEQAVQVLGPLVESYPLDERVIGAWIEALAATGRQADALDAYERLRLRLRDEMGADPGRALSQALTRVLRQEVVPDPDEAPAPPEEPRLDVLIPAQLPADTYTFTGRAEALTRLDALVRDRSASGAGTSAGAGMAARIVALIGAGGVGKTALAVHWAHRAAASFPDGQLYANLHGFSAAPPEQPIDVLGRFLRALGITGSGVPRHLDEAGALFRSLLTGRRVLVVLDNAADPAQVRPLLPGAEGCRVLVTSRDRLDGLVALDGAQPLGLDVLSERESEDLLARVLGPARAEAEPQAVRDLVRACARLPLALRIAAAQLVMRPDRSIAEFVAQLGTVGDRLDALAISGDELSQVRAVFDLSYVRLDPADRRLFRMIGALPEVDLTVGSAAALLGAGREQAEEVLDRLAAAHLITAHLPGRYDCHDLLRDFAAERAEAEDAEAERDAAARRLADWYLIGVDRAVDLVYPDRDRLPEPSKPTADADADEGAPADASVGVEGEFDQVPDAVAWLRAEHRNLLAVIDHAADRAAQDPPHAAEWPHAWRMVWSLRSHFSAAELHLDWFRAVAAAERSLAGREDPLSTAAVQVVLGDAATMRSEPVVAVDHYQRAGDASRTAGWLIGAASSHLRLGLGHFNVGDLDAARACFERALEWYHSAGQRFGEARAVGNLGLIHCDTGPLSKAVELLTRYDQTRIELGFEGARAQSLCGLGYAHWRNGNFAEARRLLEQALDLAETNGETRTARLAHCDLVALMCALGDYPKARFHAQLAESLGRQTGTPRAMTQTYFAWGLIHHGERDYARALECFDLVLRDALAYDDANHEVCALIGGSTARRALGAHEEALHQIQQALAVAHEQGSRVFESEALVELAEVHLALGHLDRARQHAEHAVALCHEVGFRLGEATAMRTLGDTLLETDGEQAARPHWTAAHDLFAELGSPEAEQLLARRG
jgi:tetratricopeptide (TPR) repeat protein/DNA-binding SARP family transcriptional activator